jgi:polysaccharide export outer membrane protein
MNNRIFPALAVLSAAFVLAGCTSVPRGAQSIRVLGNTREEPAFFSDEVSVAQMQTAKGMMPLRHEEYKVGPDDVLSISIFEWEEKEETKTLELRVSETGIISLPSVGPLRVLDRSVQEIQRLIEKALVMKNVLQSPRVGVWVSEFAARKISVIGAVSKPGEYPIHQNVSSILTMLSVAGGPRDDAANTAYVIRVDPESQATVRIKVDLEGLLHNQSSDLNLLLVPNDVVYVPVAPKVFVYGAVNHPGAFAFQRQMRLLEAVAIAGGLTPYANSSDVTLIRRTDDGVEQLYHAELARVESGRDPNVYMRDGDILRIGESKPKRAFDAFCNMIRGLFSFTYRIDK